MFPVCANAPPAINPAPLSQSAFDRRLDRLGPFEPNPRIAVAVSGGADSMALAILSQRWAASRQGGVRAFIVDHGLRAGSATDATTTQRQLAALDIPAAILTLTGTIHALPPGPALPSRARDARFTVLTAACRAEQIVHLLLGHHAADQAETLMLRMRAGSGPAGLAGMPAVRETHALRLLRPLLDVAPDQLRAVLRCEGVAWVEDPSNPTSTRGRLRQRNAPWPPPSPNDRRRQDYAIAAELAERVRLSPLGYALISPGAIDPATLAALWRTLAGRIYPPPTAAISSLAADLRPATLAGLRLLPAGRLGPGWLLVRESAALPPPIVASHGARWDRFRLHAPDLPPGFQLGPAGAAAAAELPAAIRATLPALLQNGAVIAIPQLAWPSATACAGLAIHFAPPIPLAGAPWCGSFNLEGCLSAPAFLC